MNTAQYPITQYDSHGNAMPNNLTGNEHGVYNPVSGSLPNQSSLVRKLAGSILESLNWSGTQGSQYNLNDGTFKLGGSANPKLSWDGLVLSIIGAITSTSGTIGGWTIGATSLTSTNITIDSANKRILVRDGTTNRVLIGYGAGLF